MEKVNESFFDEMRRACRTRIPVNRKMTQDDEAEIFECFQKFSESIQVTTNILKELRPNLSQMQ